MGNEMNQLSVRPAARATFDDVVLPHLDAGYRLARWLMRNDHDAEDVVQEASLRALRYFRTFAGGNGRAWFLRIVRNTCHGGRRRWQAATDPFDEERHSTCQSDRDPEALMLQTDTTALIERALGSLPTRFRELLVLRELEGLSYRELADVMEIPIGTVMSGLSRARIALRTLLSDELIERSADRVLRQADGVRTGSREESRAESVALEEAVV
jgi:RNA polymerase sigma-70 factor, ECF subfamily